MVFLQTVYCLYLFIEFSLAGAESIACGSGGAESSTTCSAGGLAWEDKGRQEDGSQLAATGAGSKSSRKSQWMLM